MAPEVEAASPPKTIGEAGERAMEAFKDIDFDDISSDRDDAKSDRDLAIEASPEAPPEDQGADTPPQDGEDAEPDTTDSESVDDDVAKLEKDWLAKKAEREKDEELARLRAYYQQSQQAGSPPAGQTPCSGPAARAPRTRHQCPPRRNTRRRRSVPSDRSAHPWP